MSYAELCTTTNFTFLTGASHPEEFVTRAADLGLAAIAITDRNTLAGVVRAYSARKELHRSVQDQGRQIPLPQLIIGCRLVLRDSAVDWVALPTDRAAYARLSRLLTLGKRRAGKGKCHLDTADLHAGCAGMILIALPESPANTQTVMSHIRAMALVYPAHVYLGAAPRYDGQDRARFAGCARLAHKAAAPMVAVGDALMHHGKRLPLADVLTCMREHITIDEIGPHAQLNAERRLKSPADMSRLFADHPAALKRSLEIATRCTFSLAELSYEYPDEISDGERPHDRLIRLSRAGLARRYPEGTTKRAAALATKELSMGKDLGFAAYFLTVHDIV